jgi:MoxR-like ATPase
VTESVQRQPYETCHSDELKLLQLSDNAPKPEGWQLSPEAVKHFILGTKIKNKTISRKIWGNDDVVEKAIVTLIGQRGLLLAGEPGTAKSMLSELLAAAISGNSKQTVQGSAGIIEENIRYSWNYALLLKSGPTPEAMVPGPMFEAMKSGTIMRFEEITRCPTEVQDNLIPIM